MLRVSGVGHKYFFRNVVTPKSFESWGLQKVATSNFFGQPVRIIFRKSLEQTAKKI
jgi:hypothetical protein